MTLACEGSATPTLATGSGSFDFARRLASLRMTLACEGSATPTLATRGGSFDFARRLASLRMTLQTVRGFEPFEIHYEATDSARAWSPIHVARMRASYGPKSGPKAGSRASSPGEQAAACDCQRTRALGRGASRSLRLQKNS